MATIVSDGLAEDTIRTFQQLACTEGHYKTLIENFVNVSPYRAIRIRLFMKMEEAFFRIHASNSFIDIIKCNLVKLFCEVSAAAAALSLNDTGFP